VKPIQPGLYRYEGEIYVVRGTIRHTETQEVLVLYGKFAPTEAMPIEKFVQRFQLVSA
jgi:hypothetical protein